MRRIPFAIYGLFILPALVGLIFISKSFCGDSVCLADSFAVPIFLPLVALYKIFGDADLIGGHEFFFVAVYWAIIGFLLGLVLDIYLRKEAHEKLLSSSTLPDSFSTVTPPPIPPTPTPATAAPIVPPPPKVWLKPAVEVPTNKTSVNLLDAK